MAKYVFNPNYLQLDYLASTGTQYIDTGITISDYPNIKLVIDGKFNTIPSSDNLMGAYTGARFHFGISGSSFHPGIYDGYTWISSDTNRHIFTLDAPTHTFSVDSTSYALTTSSTTLPSVTLTLFAEHRTDTPNINYYCTDFYLYSCQIYNGSTLLRDLEPMQRKSDNAIGLYDKANNVFYANAGTGTFNYGTIIKNVGVNSTSCDKVEVALTGYGLKEALRASTSTYTKSAVDSYVGLTNDTWGNITNASSFTAGEYIYLTFIVSDTGNTARFLMRFVSYSGTTITVDNIGWGYVGEVLGKVTVFEKSWNTVFTGSQYGLNTSWSGTTSGTTTNTLAQGTPTGVDWSLPTKISGTVYFAVGSTVSFTDKELTNGTDILLGSYDNASYGGVLAYATLDTSTPQCVFKGICSKFSGVSYRLWCRITITEVKQYY